MTSHNLLLFTSAVQKKNQQTPVFNFANKSYWLWLWSLLQICSVQRRVSLLANSGRQLSSTEGTAEELICFLSSSSGSHRVHPERRALMGKWISLVASKMSALSIPRTRHCECLLKPFEETTVLLFIILAFPVPHIIPPGHKQSCLFPRWLYKGNSGFFYTQQFRNTIFGTKWLFAKHITKHYKNFTMLLGERRGKKGERHTEACEKF